MTICHIVKTVVHKLKKSMYITIMYADYDFDDDSSFWIAFLGFAIPIVGLILFLIYEGKKPKRAKSAVKGSLAGLIFRVFFP